MDTGLRCDTLEEHPIHINKYLKLSQTKTNCSGVYLTDFLELRPSPSSEKLVVFSSLFCPNDSLVFVLLLVLVLATKHKC